MCKYSEWGRDRRSEQGILVQSVAVCVCCTAVLCSDYVVTPSAVQNMQNNMHQNANNYAPIIFCILYIHLHIILHI